jgi:peptidoglycan/LPS O-acetylase OafA/YrhL
MYAEKRLTSLDGLRGLAILMVMYDHLFGILAERLVGHAFFPVPFVRKYLTRPLGSFRRGFK